MGTRIVNNLVRHDYNLLFCEKGEAGIKRLAEKSLKVTDIEDAVTAGDIVIMAVPDARLGGISRQVTPMMKKGAVMIILDPAAAYAGELELRDDCSFVATHPCHPPLFGVVETPEERADLFGGIAAKQDIVIALVSGREEDLTEAEKICREMFAPVVKCHRITVEQMAILEPAAAEVVIAAAACLMKEALDETVKRGVPEEAARAFLLGHIQIPLAIVFNNTNPFSDAAQIAIKYGKENIFKPDWKKVFEPEYVREALRQMLHPEE